jgi:hypothetical protein
VLRAGRRVEPEARGVEPCVVPIVSRAAPDVEPAVPVCAAAVETAPSVRAITAPTAREGASEAVRHIEK